MRETPEQADRAVRALVADAVGTVHRFEVVRRRPWSTVWRAVTDAGVVFAKENCPPQAHEAALLRHLATVAPDLVVPVLAVDPATGRFVTPDLGTTLGERGPLGLPGWGHVLAAAVELQRRAAPHALGWRLTTLDPARIDTDVARLVAALTDLPVDDARSLPAAEAAALTAALPALAEEGQRLAALGLPLSVDHNDLHAHNVLGTPDRPRFFDLGDAVLGHPLPALRVPLVSLAEELGADPKAPLADRRVRRVADAALEPWTDLAPAADLRAVLPTALRLGALARAESWWRCLAAMDDAGRAEYGEAARRWLVQLAPHTG